MSAISLFQFKESGMGFSKFLLPCKDIKCLKRRSCPKQDKKKNNKRLIKQRIKHLTVSNIQKYLKCY